MSIIDRTAAYVEPTLVDTTDHAEPFVPSDADLTDYAKWLGTRDDLDVQYDDDEPIEAVEDTTDHDDEDMGPWWRTLPESPDLDSRWGLTLAGGRRSATAVGPDEEARMNGR